jgi:hypothetical protein
MAEIFVVTKAPTINPAAYPALAKLADRLEPALRRRFIQAVQAAKSNVDLERLASAIQQGNVSQAEVALNLQTWPEKFGGLAVDLRAGFHAGAEQGLMTLENVGMAMSFRYIDTHTVEYARSHLPKLVQSLRANARMLTREIVTEAVEGKWTPYEAAQSIRDWIGLTPQYASALSAFEEDLVQRGIDEDKILARVEKKELSYLKLRAETIARTEIQTAANQGQLATWDEAIMQGLLPKTVRKVWLTAPDERLCEECEALGESESVLLHEVFMDDEGDEDVTSFGEPLITPPVHPNCRCTMVIES